MVASKKRMQKSQFFLAVSCGDLLLKTKAFFVSCLTKDLQMTPPGKTEFFAYDFSEKRSTNKGEKMPVSELNVKASLCEKTAIFEQNLKKKTPNRILTLFWL